ncbi:MAG: hypothetical protein LRY69_02190 [Gammaproteobacteria bacterium]|nr:hypothetical protein [Gammaproteobacteria bacterium]
MKENVFALLIFCIGHACWGVTPPCVPYTNSTYSVHAHGATGTLVKTQTCDENTYTITSIIDVKKGFFQRPSHKQRQESTRMQERFRRKNLPLLKITIAYPTEAWILYH